MVEKNLPFCFRRLVRRGDLTEKIKTKYVKYLNQICDKNYNKKSYDEILDLWRADSELYVQLSKAESENLDRYSKDIKNIEILCHKDSFKDEWRKRGWIDQIFKLLFLEK